MKPKKNYDNLHLFIQKFVKSKYAFILTLDVKDTLNEIIKIISDKYIQSSIELTKYSNRITVDSFSISTLTKMWFPEVSQVILQKCNDKWDYYSNFSKPGRKKVFFLQPSRFKTFFFNKKYSNQKISETSPVYLCCILEEFLTLILDNIDKNISCLKTIHIYDSLYDHLYLKRFLKEYLFLAC